MTLTLADVAKWNPEAIRDVAKALTKKGASAQEVADGLGKLPIIVALNATPDTSIASPSTNSAAPCRRRRVEGARRVPPRTLDANLGSSA